MKRKKVSIILAIVVMSVFFCALAWADAPPVSNWTTTPPVVKVWKRVKSRQGIGVGEGLFFVSDRPAENLSLRKALVIQSDLLPYVDTERYHNFWEKCGWSTIIYGYKFGGPEDLRELEKSLHEVDNRLINLHLAGDEMPHFVFEMMTSWEGGDPLYNCFISDFPFEYPNENFADSGFEGTEKGNGILDHWENPGGSKPQIIVSRLVTRVPKIGSPQWVVENFYEKLYSLYKEQDIGNVLVAIDDGLGSASEDVAGLQSIYGNRQVQARNDVSDGNNVTKNKVLNWLERSRIFSMLYGHGGSWAISFKRNGKSERIWSEDLVARQPLSQIYYLKSCGAGYFADDDNIGNAFIALERGGLAALAFTGVTRGLWGNTSIFYESLQTGKSFVEAYKEFLSQFDIRTPEQAHWLLREFGSTVILGEGSVNARLRYPLPDLAVKWKKPVINADKSLSVKLVISNEGYVPSPACMVRLYIKKGRNEPVLVLERSMKILPKRKRIVDLEIPAVDLPNLPFQLIAEANPLSEGQRLFEEESYANNTAVVKVE